MSQPNEYDLSTTQAAPQPPVAQPIPQTPVPANAPGGDYVTKTPFDRLKALISQEVTNEPITLDIPTRPGLSIRFNTNVTNEEIDQWRKQSTVGNRAARRGGEPEVDGLKMMALVCYAKTEAFLVDGEVVEMPGTDQPLTFYDTQIIKEAFGIRAATNTDLVRRVFANDAYVASAGGQIMEAAGYGDELPEASRPN